MYLLAESDFQFDLNYVFTFCLVYTRFLQESHCGWLPHVFLQAECPFCHPLISVKGLYFCYLYVVQIALSSAVCWCIPSCNIVFVNVILTMCVCTQLATEM